MASTFISSPSRNDLLSYAALFVFVGIYAAFLIPFVAHDGLSTFRNDSSYYLLMARYLSPWHEASPAVVAASSIQNFPPFFPFILAISGAAYDYTLAHVVTALFLLLSIPLIFILARGMFATNLQALLIVFIFCLSPSAWLNSMGILSENLYLFLSLGTLIFFDKADLSRKINLFIFGLLLALLVLTRTIGVAMLAAFILLCILKWRRRSLDWPYFVIPVFFSLTLIAAFWGTAVPSHYITSIVNMFGLEAYKANIDWHTEFRLVGFQHGWLVGLLYYWSVQTVMAKSIIMFVGLFSLLGLCLRIAQGKLDAIYVFLYLLVLFIWPYTTHMGRFIYPVLCILLLYSFYALYTLVHRVELKRGDAAVSIAMVLALTAVLPTLSYTWNRYQAGKEAGYHRIKDFYHTYDLEQARESAAMPVTMFLDMAHMKKTTEPDAVIQYFKPSYIALLADRVGREITIEENSAGELYMQPARDVDYVYLTKIHPWINEEVNGLNIDIRRPTNVLWVHSTDNNEPFSAFFEIRD